MKILCKSFNQHCCIKLHSLILKSTCLGMKGCEYLSESLSNKIMNDLEVIDISSIIFLFLFFTFCFNLFILIGNDIGDKGIYFLVKAWKTSCCLELKYIDLRCIFYLYYILK